MIRFICITVLLATTIMGLNVTDDASRRFNSGKDTTGLQQFHCNIFWEKNARVKCPPGFVKKPLTSPRTRNQCETRIICNGYVLNGVWILTAGHCVAPPDRNLKEMSIGHGSAYKEDLIHYPIKFVVVHARYRSPGDYYDIALIRPSFALKLSESSPLMNIDNLPRFFVATMYGRGKGGGEDWIPYPKLVRYVKIHDRSRDCALQDEYKMINLRMCYNLISVEDIGRGRVAKSFGGDSGSPILADDMYNKGQRYLIGIHTARSPLSAYDGEEVRAGVNVAGFCDWIYYVKHKYAPIIDQSNGRLYCCSAKEEREYIWRTPLEERHMLNVSTYA